MKRRAPRWIAVLGAANDYDRVQLEQAYQCGVALAQAGFHLLTGATSGIPHAAALGARDAGALVVGISPAMSPREHAKHRPLGGADLIVYAGLGADGRAPLIMRSVSAAVFIGGQMGTLAEFAAGWLCGCPLLAVLESSGGICVELRRLTGAIRQKWGSAVIFDDAVPSLVARVKEFVDRAPRSEPRDAMVDDIVSALREVRPC